MAKSTKSVKKATPAGRKTAGRRRPQRKPAAKKVPARQPTTRPAARRPAKKQSRTPVTAIANLLPSPVGGNEYVSRTLAIIEQDRRRRARSRATRARQLEGVVKDVKHDIATRINAVEESAVQTLEGLASRVRSIRVVQQAVGLPDQVTEQVTEAMDSVLGRVGLMRKALNVDGATDQPARRRRRAA